MYSLIAQFPRQQVCRDRQYTGLLRWSSYYTSAPIPTEKPDEVWVKNRIVAGRITANPDVYVAQTINATIGVEAIQTNIRQHLHAYNDEATEAAMDLQIDNALGKVMPIYVAGAVTDAEVEAWYNANGFPPEPPPQSLLQQQQPVMPPPPTM